MIMKENQNPTSYDSLSFGSKEVFEAKVSNENNKATDDISMDNEVGTIDPERSKEVFEVKVSDENHKVTGDISMDNEVGVINSKRKGDQNGPLDLAGGLEKELDSLSLDTHDKVENGITAEELETPCNGNECIVSISSPCDGASDLFETVTDVFTDKKVLECELPELEVTKDICVDNGTSEIKEDKDGKAVDQERLIASSVGSSEKDTPEHCDLSELELAATKSSEEDPLVDKKHPVQEVGTLVLPGSFPDSSNNGGEKLMQPSYQIEGSNCESLIQDLPIENAVSVGPTSSSPELEDNVQAGSLLFNRNEESGRITFDFSDTGHNSSIVDLQEQPDDSSATSNISNEKQHEDGNSDDLSLDGKTLSPSDRSQSSTNDDAPAVGPKLQNDRGEASFSAATCSDQVPFSGSISHRSDASTTSARSFAFPVLQSEWNSSPVRMAKADRRHFRKQKGWRLGLLCCRF